MKDSPKSSGGVSRLTNSISWIVFSAIVAFSGPTDVFGSTEKAESAYVFWVDFDNPTASRIVFSERRPGYEADHDTCRCARQVRLRD